jgi:sugar lactone lactonase YvrE
VTTNSDEVPDWSGETMHKLLQALAVVSLIFSALALAQTPVPVVRLDPAMDGIVSPNARVEKVAGGFLFTEGPVWLRKGGFLIFSDINANVIHKWDPRDGKSSVFLSNSGFTGTAVGVELGGLGSNGITLDREGRVVYCAHGDRQIVRLEGDGRRSVLASHFEGKRLNSPDDLIYKSDGALYFTDPLTASANGIKIRKRNFLSMAYTCCSRESFSC